MTTGAVLRIEVEQKGAQCSLVFRAGGISLPIASILWDQIAEARKAIRIAFRDFQAAVGEELALDDWPRLNNAINEFDKTGHALLFRLLGQERRDLDTFLRKRAPLLSAHLPGLDGPLPVIEVDSKGDHVHFEALPLLAFDKCPKVTGSRSLRRALSRFLGMTTVVRRTALKTPHPDLCLRKAGRLPIKIFADPSLDGSETEVAFFNGLSEHFDVDGPWPTGRVPENSFADRLASFLTRPEVTFSNKRRDPIDQIHHIACHCYIGETLSLDNRLQFSTGKRRYEARLRDLEAAYGHIIRRRRPGDRSPPLVFLNACTSVSVDVQELCSFPSLLLASHRGVIGTESRIPDEVAAEFSAAFYHALLEGNTVGQSLQRAKWHLVTEHNNPLGLVYTLYADPNLYVSGSEKTGGADVKQAQV